MSSLHRIIWEPVVVQSLSEDLGRGGDVTTDSIIPADVVATANLVARAAGRIAGLEIASAVFGMVDPAVFVESAAEDGDDVAADTSLAMITGPARGILTAERTALNLLGHLSGIATATRDTVQLIVGTGASVAETRKTTPGLRALEKYATRVGGARNHRFGLDDAVLIKDNHIAVAGGVGKAIEAARRRAGHLMKIEVEVESLVQLADALKHPVDVILLDNMTNDELRQAVQMIDGRAITEASGAITPETARAVAETGVDVLSMGWLTHSAPNLDVALDVVV